MFFVTVITITVTHIILHIICIVLSEKGGSTPLPSVTNSTVAWSAQPQNSAGAEAEGKTVKHSTIPVRCKAKFLKRVRITLEDELH